MASGSVSTFVGANLRRLRKSLGLTQAQLAEKAGLNGRHLQRIERGLVDLKIESLATLAREVGVSPGALLRPAKLEPSKPGRPARRAKAKART